MSTGSCNSRFPRARMSFAAMAPQNDYGNLALGAVPGIRRAAQRPGRRRRALRAGPAGRRGPAGGGLRHPDRRPVHSRTGRRDGGGRLGAGRQQHQDAAPWHRRLERFAGAPAARRCRAPGSPRPTTPASTRSRSATRRSSTAEPTRLATLAYDAVTLAGRSPRRRGRPFHQKALTNLSGFNGADGVFRFRSTARTSAAWR